MEESVRLEIFGTSELAQMFDEMTVELQTKVIKSGFRKAAKLILDKTEVNLNTATKSAAKISKALGTKMTSGELEMMVGVKKKGAGNLAHLIEDGTVERFYISKGNNKTFGIRKNENHATGKMTGQHFFENAIDETQGEVLDNISKFILDSFIRLVNKYEKGAISKDGTINK